MNLIRPPVLGLMAFTALVPRAAPAQTFRTDDPVVHRIWSEGMEHSQTEQLAQALMDSIGPRLSGSPGFVAATDWLLARYVSWGVGAQREQYGTWRGWRQGAVHVDLVAPRVQTLVAHLLSWSPGTGGEPVEADVVAVPDFASDDAAEAWLPSVAGKIVLASQPEPICREPQAFGRLARPQTVQRWETQRDSLRRSWQRRLSRLRSANRRIEDAGAVAVLTSEWSLAWGANKIFDARTRRVPSLDLSCEDYGLVYRLTANRQGARLRIVADAESLGTVPMFNVIARLQGTERPNEYVVLSAHLDSWAGATGTTDNGTGTITMLEAMRILHTAYPRPRRTILVGHWGGEEQGAIGSRSFTEDHPEVLENLQVLFNQDNGTWRIEYLESQGFSKAGASLARWIAQVPPEIADNIELDFPGPQENLGSDHSSFLCHQVPAFRIQSNYPDYRQYTWHTNLDTFDKIVFDDLKNNATLAAMLAYEASEDPERVPRDRSILPPDARTGAPRAWPSCSPARRSWQ